MSSKDGKNPCFCMCAAPQSNTDFSGAKGRRKMHLRNYLHTKHLRNYLHTNKWDNTFQVDKHLLGFGQNGVDVVVEYSGEIGYFVDILVKSSRPFAKALEFVQEHVVQKLREFCAEPQGCQGVLLEEFVIRPICVKRLDACEERLRKSLSSKTRWWQIQSTSIVGGCMIEQTKGLTYWKEKARIAKSTGSQCMQSRRGPYLWRTQLPTFPVTSTSRLMTTGSPPSCLRVTMAPSCSSGCMPSVTTGTMRSTTNLGGLC